jgi:hypothetical protein
VGVRGLETLRQFQINFFGFSALDVNSCLEATFDVGGKRQQHKRHDKPRHRQPESAASGTTASLQAWPHHGRSTLFPGSSESNETAPVIGHIHDKGQTGYSLRCASAPLTMEVGALHTISCKYFLTL